MTQPHGAFLEAKKRHTTPALSICMAAYNAADFLAETLDSLVKQTFTDFEAIVVDDGSIDATYNIIAQYALQDARIKFYRKKINRGLIYTRNRTLEQSNAPFSLLLMRMTINKIDNWDYSDELFFEIKYKDLIEDQNLFSFHEAFVFIWLKELILTKALKIAYENSLFSGFVVSSNHIRSGKTRQWTNYFTPKLKHRFHELYADLLVKLGYENDSDW